MALLGAQLDDLAGLAHRLSTTSADVGTARESSVSTSTNVITAVADAAQQALTAITTQMEQLEASVAGAVAQAEGTQWTGANADRFRGAAQEFHGAMSAGQRATTEAFQSFQASVGAMNDTLGTYVQQFGTALTSAQDSATQMSAAVESQRANLDQVMNAGLSVL